MSLFLAVKVSFRVAREEITYKKEIILICYIYLIHINKVSFRGLHKLWPRPDWSLLGVKFKISNEHPCPFHMGVPPPGGGGGFKLCSHPLPFNFTTLIDKLILLK